MAAGDWRWAGPTDAGRDHSVKRVSGFTLLEVLVALAVLAIAMGAIISAVTQSITTIATLRERTFAGWVALNQINVLLLETEPWPEEGARTGVTELAGRVWRWEAQFHPSELPDLRRLELAVRADVGGPELSTLIAFKGALPAKPANATASPSPAQQPSPTPPVPSQPLP